MKKLLVAILAILYISASFGATVHIHYCMGKLADWGLTHKNSATCDKCGMTQSAQKNNGCCNDENKFLKNTSDQTTIESTFQISPILAVALPVPFFEIPSTDILSITEENPISHAPPRNSGVAVYISNRVFRI